MRSFLMAVIALAGFWTWGNTIFIFFENQNPSVSIGRVQKGYLIHGKRLPTSGKNFKAYSRLGAALGRNGVHNRVRDAVLDAYRAVESQLPDSIFVYGETGWLWGGPFAPHKTHQNGLSVDFFVPIRNLEGKAVTYPAKPWNAFGYGLDFDAQGRSSNLQIDFEAMAVHLKALADSANRNGLAIQVVIFDNALQTHLFKTNAGRALVGHVPFSKTKPWVRHDEHYHVNFRLLEE